MRHLKFVLFSFTFLVSLILVISFLMPSTVRVSRVETVMAPSDSIFNLIAYVENWNRWHPYLKDSTIKTKYGYLKNGEESYFEILKNGQSAAKFTIDSTMPDHITLYLESGNYKKSNGSIQMVRNGNYQTIVEWSVVFKLKWYPWEKFRGIYLDRVFGPTLEQALKNLKSVAEQ